MKRKRLLISNALTAAALILAVLGIISGSLSFIHFTTRLLKEHRSHLEDIARSVDQNTFNVLENIRSKLRYSVENCLEVLETSPIGSESLIDDLVTVDGDGTVNTLRGTKGKITLFENNQDKGFCLGIDEDEGTYLAFLTEGADGVTYGALMSFDTFYKNIVVNSITFHYWVVLYDQSLNLMLQNEVDQPAFLMLNREDILRREDGYSILQRRELENASGTDLYSYIHCETGKKMHCQMAVLSSADSRNGSLAIGVAADTSHITSAANTAFVQLLFCSGMIVTSIVLLLYGILIRTRQRNQVSEKLELTEKLLEKQKELARNQRLEALGVMTSAIAHEFNNLLTPITGYSLMCLENLPEDSGELYDNLLAIYEAADKAKNTVHRLSSLTRKSDDSKLTVHCPDEIVTRVLELSSPSKPKRVEVSSALHCENARIRVNETQILQVLLNFLLNSFQAMEGMAGNVTVTTGIEAGDVVFSVEDTGPGIPPEILERIFEPFFTTKEIGKGSGLGLAIAQQVAEFHGGRITVRSDPGAGVCFRLFIPLHDEVHFDNGVAKS